jgi:TetR/AcrR family transcriptional regulator, transcriptional repressor for nem operon
MQLNDTANKILDIAEGFTQTRGFNAFSYKDIQRELGIKTSSIHYYFPTKQDLAISMMERYLRQFKEQLEEIAQRNTTAKIKLETLANLFISAAKEGKFCLCGMLAADILAMPSDVNEYLGAFFAANELWIAERIREGVRQREFKGWVHPEHAAAHLLATLEGGMLIARTRKQAEYLEAVVTEALEQLNA